MKTSALLFLILAMAVPVSAQDIILKNGKVVAAKNLQRQGDTIMATVELAAAQAGQPAATGQFGYPIAQIEKIDFPEPAELKMAADLITAGKADEALVKLEPVVRYYQAFRDAPGSWWADASLLKADILTSLGRDDEAEQLAAELVRNATDPQTVLAAKIYVARGIARHGDQDKAMEMYDAILKDATQPGTIAAADVNKGQIYLARKQWEPALLSFLELPVFYPRQKVFMPRVLLGCGHAYLGMEDFERAKTSLNDLTSGYGSTPEAAQAKIDLERIAKLEKTN